MKNPRINRLIGYLILFGGFFFFGAGWMLAQSENIMVFLGVLLCMIGAALFAVSTIWMIKKVRCPHCGALLQLKLYPISKCPYCGKRTDTD